MRIAFRPIRPEQPNGKEPVRPDRLRRPFRENRLDSQALFLLARIVPDAPNTQSRRLLTRTLIRPAGRSTRSNVPSGTGI